jgi:predicted helicase
MGPESIGNHVKDYNLFHVSGKMNSSTRDSILKDFRESPQAVVSNAKCLTEGVDVPAVDMVAFLSPKKSSVDIVQATGRAMRRLTARSWALFWYQFMSKLRKVRPLRML